MAHGETIQGLAKFLPKEVRSALEECVQAKIPKIAEDHPEMSEQQRIAIAYSTCGEKGLKWAKDMNSQEDMVTEPSEKAGAAYIKAYCSLHSKHYGSQENEDLKGEMDRHKSMILDMAKEKYPEAVEGSTGEHSGPAAAAAAANEAVAPYTKPPKSFSFGVTKDMKARGMTVLRKAADHMHEVSRLPGEGEITKSHCKAFEESHYHARALDALQGAMAHEMEGDKLTPDQETTTEEPEGETGEAKALDYDKINAMLDRVEKVDSKVNNRVRKLTGGR